MKDLTKIADILWNAQSNRIALDIPISNSYKTLSLEDAYEIQNLNSLKREDQGEHIVGKKIGLTSKKVQEQLGVDQPDFGTLFNTMEVLNGAEIEIKELMQPKVEAEIAIVLGNNLDMENPTILDVLQCIDFALPSLEIVGSRIKDWNIKIIDTIADNASASHYVLGHSPKTIDEFNIVECSMILKRNGDLVSEGKGKDCMGSPLNSLLWLAKKMQEVGDPLQAGDLILTGALGPMVHIEKGDIIEAEFSGLGGVSVKFV